MSSLKDGPQDSIHASFSLIYSLVSIVSAPFFRLVGSDIP
jgi:hypothetical protein